MNDNKKVMKQKIFGMLDDALSDVNEARRLVADLDDMGYFDAPASTCYHGSHPGGLVEHSINVAEALVTLSRDNGLAWEKLRSAVIVGLFHDLCKCDAYKHPATGASLNGQKIYDPTKYEHNPHTLLKGHGDKSVMMAASLLQLTREEVMCIRYHMGAFTDKSEWNDYTRAVRKFPNVLYTHTADMIAAHIVEV